MENNKIAVIDLKIEELAKKVDINIKNIEHILKSNHQEEIEKIKHHNELKELITEAVRDGVNPIYEKISKLEDRIITIENEKKEKALIEKEQREIDMRENKRHLIRTILTIIGTFLATLVINNIFSVIIDKLLG